MRADEGPQFGSESGAERKELVGNAGKRDKGEQTNSPLAFCDGFGHRLGP
jgi:hypothetical protein